MNHLHPQPNNSAPWWREIAWTSRGTALHVPLSAAGTSGFRSCTASERGGLWSPTRTSRRAIQTAAGEAANINVQTPVCRPTRPAGTGPTVTLTTAEAPLSRQRPSLQLDTHEPPSEQQDPDPGGIRCQLERHRREGVQLQRLETSAYEAATLSRSGEEDVGSQHHLGSSSSPNWDPGRKRTVAVGGRQVGSVAQVLPRRSLLAAFAASLAAGPATALSGALVGAAAVPGAASAAQRTPAQCRQAYAPFLVRPDYSGPGPLAVARLPRREHTCASCFPACVNATCTLKVDVVYPKGGPELGLGPPFPLAIFSAGFLLGSESYMSYAERLASWGYTVLMYDRNETVASLLDDAACVRLLVELMDWAAADPLLRRLADPGAGVYMVGHSRGGKLAALAGAEDARVAALCLIDPVDNTVYAPLAPGFPSALAALRNMPRERLLPLAVVGGGLGGDCAPRQANYRRFFAASTAPCWEVGIPEAGHFQFLDSLSGLQRALCPTGDKSDDEVRSVGLAVMVAWAESMIRHRGADIFHLPVPYPSACQTEQPPQSPSPSSLLPAPSSSSEDPRRQFELQLPQLAQLQQRQGLRGQASLAQAAYAAAIVQREPLLADAERESAPERSIGSGGRDQQQQQPEVLQQVQDSAKLLDREGLQAFLDPTRMQSDPGDERARQSDEGVGMVAAVGRSGVAEEGPVLSLPPAEAAASSRVRPGRDRRDPSGDRDSCGGGAGGSPSDGCLAAPGPGLQPSSGRVVVVQEALRLGLDRLVTRLEYDTGLRLEARYKNFDDEDNDVRRLLYGGRDERQWPEGAAGRDD